MGRYTSTTIVKQCGKMILLDKMLPRLRAEGASHYCPHSVKCTSVLPWVPCATNGSTVTRRNMAGCHTGHKVLIFSQMKRVLDVIHDYADWRGYPVERLDGDVNMAERQVGRA